MLQENTGKAEIRSGNDKEIKFKRKRKRKMRLLHVCKRQGCLYVWLYFMGSNLRWELII